MKRISGSIFFMKYMFPVFWFGFVGSFLVIVLFTERSEGGWFLFAIIVPTIMGILGYSMMKKMVWDLADEVLDAGNALVIRFGKEQEMIPLAEIVNVSYCYMMSPARVTLTLRQPCRFGSEISFATPQRFSFVPFPKSSEIAELIRRVDAARQASG
jgi:hypothetical protein